MSGEAEAGFKIMTLPAASDGATFQAAMRMGKFHGVMPAVTPTGSRTTMLMLSPGTSRVWPCCSTASPA